MGELLIRPFQLFFELIDLALGFEDLQCIIGERTAADLCDFLGL